MNPLTSTHLIARPTFASTAGNPQEKKVRKLLKPSASTCVFALFIISVPAPHTAGAEAGPNLPATLSAVHFKELLESSPFTRTLNLSDTLALTGVASIDGKPVLTLLNRTTNESHLVSEEPNQLGWKLLEIYPAQELGKVEAKVSAGDGQVVSVRFDEKQLNPVAEKNTAKPSGPPQPGDGRQRPPGPPQAGQRGPNPEIMEKYKTLSPEQQQRFREIMREQLTKNKDMSPEDRSKVIEQAFENLKR